MGSAPWTNYCCSRGYLYYYSCTCFDYSRGCEFTSDPSACTFTCECPRMPPSCGGTYSRPLVSLPWSGLGSWSTSGGWRPRFGHFSADLDERLPGLPVRYEPARSCCGARQVCKLVWLICPGLIIFKLHFILFLSDAFFHCFYNLFIFDIIVSQLK